MKIVALSDTHGKHNELTVPDGDVLVVAGDFLRKGYQEEIYDFRDWLRELPHIHKIIVAGNHDWAFYQDSTQAQRKLSTLGIFYLEDASKLIGDVMFYGSPWTPPFMDWAFMKPRNELYRIWERVPRDIDVLVTHGPPYGIFDKNIRDARFGDEVLRTFALDIIRPKVHIFGHAHASWGTEEIESTRFYNVSVAGEDYKITQQPTVIDIGE